MKKLKNTCIYLFVSLLIRLVRGLPRSWAMRFLVRVGLACHSLIKTERKKAVRHLQLVFGNNWPTGKIENTARAVFANLGRNATDVIRFARHNRDRFFRTHFTCKGWEHAEKAHARGKGVVFLTGHVGAFELLHHFIAWKGHAICVTGTQIYDPRLNRLITKNRVGPGIAYVERGRDSAREIIRHLRQGNAFGVLIDQDTRVEGVFAPFLGIEAYTPSTPAKLAMKIGAAIVPIVVRMNKENVHEVTVEPEVPMAETGNAEADLVENVTRCNNVISKWIRETPDQWVWMHERWKTKRKGPKP